jgi:hypothetical protein
MLIRTELRPSLGNGRGLLTNDFLRDLARHSILVAPRNFYTEKPEWMSETVYRDLKQLMSRGALSWRLMPEKHANVTDVVHPWSEDSPTRVEVVVAGEGERAPLKCEVTQPERFRGTAAITDIQELLEVPELLTDRADFWRKVVEPLLDALRPSRRSLVISDLYLVDHVARTQRRGGNRGWGGLDWLLMKINSNSVRNGATTQVALYGSFEKESESQLESFTRQLRDWVRDYPELEVTVNLVDRDLKTQEPTVWRAMHQRFILVGKSRGVVLDQGLDSLTPVGPRADEELHSLAGVTFSSSWSYRRQLGEGKGDLLDLLQKRDLVLERITFS